MIKSKWHLVYIISLLFISHSVNASTFDEMEVWTFNCVVKNVPGHPASNAKNKKRKFEIYWNRVNGKAKYLNPNGNGKGIQEIPGFSETPQYTTHFWMSPATAKYTGEETRNSKYGFWLESFGPSMISVRSTGEISITGHDIIYGGMKAFSETGNCEITGENLPKQ